MALRHVEATRYVTPLREGGSLPALVEADDDGLYVLKFAGAGQGRRALLAEVVAGELARALGFRVPELVVAELDPVLANAEPDPEIQDLLRASAGPNLGVDFLPGSLTYNPAAPEEAPPATLAAAIVWLDALVTNVDRTAKNPNLLLWHRALWLIDHGAALYFHHAEQAAAGHERGRFPPIREHVLLPHAGSILEADERLAPRVSDEMLASVTELIPEAWLDGDDRGTYARYLRARLEAPRAWVDEAEEARARR